MNTKSHIINQVTHDKASSFVVEQKEKMSAPIEVTMYDIATKLRSIYAQMQMKHSPRRYSTLQGSVDNGLKSYLDDISRAILAEHYTRRQEEKKFFEHLEQIKMLVQSLHNKKNGSKESEGAITHNISHLKSPASVIHHLAHMACEESKNHSSHQKVPNFLGQNSANTIQTHTVNTFQQVQQDRKSFSPTNVVKPSLKEDEGLVVHSVTAESRFDTRASRSHIVDDQYAPPLKTEPLGTFSFLRYSVKKLLACFLIIAFMAGITLCFYSFLRGYRFF